jgi:hypothetical protein
MLLAFHLQMIIVHEVTIEQTFGVQIVSVNSIEVEFCCFECVFFAVARSRFVEPVDVDKKYMCN